jgi:uncharacterized protein (TIGR00156 family)
MKGVIVQVGAPKSIVLFNNGRIGAMPTPEDCHVGMVVTVNYNDKLKIAALALAALLLIGLGVFIGVSVVKGRAAAPAADPAPPAGAAPPAGRAASGPALTVEQAKTLPDDSPVELTGTIDRFLGDEKYLFRDAAGSIVIEIERKNRGDFSVGDTVRIRGEVDVDREGTVIEVKTINRIAGP